MIADQIINGSKNFIYVESSCFLLPLNLAEQAVLTFRRENCQQDTFVAELSECDSKIAISFNLIRCLEREGKWTIEVKQNGITLLKDVTVRVNSAVPLK